MSKRLTKTIWYGSDVDSNGNPILPSTHGGLDGLNYGELYLHLSNGKATLWTLSSDGKIVEITGGGSVVDMSSYLLKSIWDKVWEIRTDSQGTEYIFCKLPVVTQYGITMYSGDGVDVPSLASGLPFDGRTIWYNPDTQQIEVIGGTGGGSGEGVSNFWDLSGIPSWITNSKPKYTYSEIEGTPDLSGFATQNWIISQGYASAEELKKYIPISGYTEVSGEKNFTGGLKVNGSPIYYDSAKKYWKLEGDLLVTGGVTMYGSDSSFVPSTIMDAIAVDGTTISKDGGVLKVIGGTGGGVADSVAWANITGKPTWIGSSKPSYSYSEITGAISTTELQNYLTQNSYLNVTSGDIRYLKLSGGTLTGENNILSLSGATNSYIYYNIGSTKKASTGYYNNLAFLANETTYARLGIADDGTPQYHTDNKGSKICTIWHSGNSNPTDANRLISLYGMATDENTSDRPTSANITFVDKSLRYFLATSSMTEGKPSDDSKILHFAWDNRGWGAQLAMPSSNANMQFRTQGYGGLAESADVWNDWRTIIDDTIIGNYNAGSATKIKTARTIWGQSFDGTQDIIGSLYIGGDYGVFLNKGQEGIYITGNGINWHNSSNAWVSSIIRFDKDGNVGIGATSSDYKLHVNGSGYFSSYLSIGTASSASLSMNGTSANYITTPSGGYMVFCMGGNGTNVSTSNLALYMHNVVMAMSGGKVGIGNASPNDLLDIINSKENTDTMVSCKRSDTGYHIKFGIGSGGVNRGIWDMNLSRWLMYSDTSSFNITYNTWITQPNWDNGLNLNRSVVGGGCGITIWSSNSRIGIFGINGSKSFEFSPDISGSLTQRFTVDSNGNGLFYGGVTMYSDQRKKTILNHVELSLKQIANAPLIEHYYNSDEKKTTHVGSIAQYWASMNDWFCKLDSEGYYTMEIQNAALASAISIARELDRYETKTDKAIKKLKKRICELEEEVERLKAS